MAFPVSNPFIWCSAGVRAETTAARNLVGWLPGEPLSAEASNHLWGVLSDYVYYFATDVAPSDMQLRARIFKGDDVDPVLFTGLQEPAFLASQDAIELIAGAGAGADVLTSFLMGDNAFVFGTYEAGNALLLPDKASFSTYVQRFAYVHGIGFAITDLRISTGLLDAEAGATAGDNATTGHRWGYPSGDYLTLAYDLSASAGAWGPEVSAAIDAVRFDSSSGELVTQSLAGTATVVVSRDLAPFIAHNAQATIAVASIVSIAAELDVNAATNVLVEIVRKTRAATTELVLFSLPASGTPHTGAKTAYSDNNGGSPVLIDLATYSYRVRITSVGVGVGTTGGGVEDLILTILKTAVE